MFISKTQNYDKDPTNPDRKQFSVKIAAVIFNYNVKQTSNRNQISFFSETSRCLKLKNRHQKDIESTKILNRKFQTVSLMREMILMRCALKRKKWI